MQRKLLRGACCSYQPVKLDWPITLLLAVGPSKQVRKSECWISHLTLMPVMACSRISTAHQVQRYLQTACRPFQRLTMDLRLMRCLQNLLNLVNENVLWPLSVKCRTGSFSNTYPSMLMAK